MTITDDEARQWRKGHSETYTWRDQTSRVEHEACLNCQGYWPCPTIRLLDERERLREALRAVTEAARAREELLMGWLSMTSDTGLPFASRNKGMAQARQEMWLASMPPVDALQEATR